MLYLSIEIRSAAGEVPNLADFIRTDPFEVADPASPPTREYLLLDIQRAADRRLGPDTKLVQILGSHGSPEVILIMMFTGGVAAYKFVKDYPDLRQGVKLLLQDIKTIVKKIVGEDFDVDQKYPPEAGDNIDLCETGTGVSS